MKARDIAARRYAAWIAKQRDEEHEAMNAYQLAFLEGVEWVIRTERYKLAQREWELKVDDDE